MDKVFKADHLGLAGNPVILKLLSKQGDKLVLFTDTVIKVDRNAKLWKRILLITDQAFYVLDVHTYKLKRRIGLQHIQMLCLSELNDNFFAVIVPSEYDYLLASARKTEIMAILVEASKKLQATGGTAIPVQFSNRFEYTVDSENVRVVTFEDTDGGVCTKISTR
ncbi:hypothetical protein CBR_g39340 [Chara braunii]|uniref:TH1 domain-containing protein n=1 Tax=Chara braunii TaxID=69332 RepID=A0A388LRB3_CHABU|nr:hypothetical protein CBR_g39340 [Chara braunii]|eukprot:GBG84878.1 hypothetical protein CBR_g39340 [Chara braunii]